MSLYGLVAHPVTQALLCPNAVVHALAVVAGARAAHERATAPTVVPPIEELTQQKTKEGAIL